MADQFQIIPYQVRSAGTDVPPEEVQRGLNSLAQQTTIALNTIVGEPEPPTGPAGGDLSGTYPNPTVAAVHATSGTINGVTVGATTPATGAFTTLTATTPMAVTSGGTGRNALTANAVILGEGSSQVNFAAPGAAGTLLASNGVAADPSFQTAATLNVALTTNPLSQFAATTSAQLAGIISDETGSGSLVFGTSPTLAIPAITGGTINNATVGATTPSTGAFTTLSASSGLNNTAVGNTTPSTGAFTTLSSTGTFTPSQTNGIVGTTTNNNANAGSVGEYISSTVLGGAAVALTTGTPTNVTSISLTAGDWDVSGAVNFLNGSGVTITYIGGCANTVSATLNSGNIFLVSAPGFTQATVSGCPIPTIRVSIASTTTVFLVAQCGFAAGTLSAFGNIGARRRR